MNTIRSSDIGTPADSSDRIGLALRASVILAAFLMPLSISLAEGFCFIAIALWVAGAVRARNWAGFKTPLTPFILGFTVIALACGMWGTHPSISIGRFHRLIIGLFPLAMLGAYAAHPDRLRKSVEKVAVAFVAGACLLAAYDLVRVPIQVARGVGLFDTGNMRDPQFHMVALCLILAMQGSWSRTLRSRGWLALALLSALGLVIHFKRGVWMSFGLVFTSMALLKRRKAWLAVLLLGAIGMLALPQTRERLMDLRSIGNVARGDRAAIWSEVAPGIIADHPWGFGYMALTHEDMLRYSRNIQPGLNHLHNNVLQIRLELGWPGILVWLGWMGVALGLLVRAARRESRFRGSEAPLGQGALAAFCALLLNGMVEYNFGDTEILMVFNLLIGMAACLAAAPIPREHRVR